MQYHPSLCATVSNQHWLQQEINAVYLAEGHKLTVPLAGFKATSGKEKQSMQYTLSSGLTDITLDKLVLICDYFLANIPLFFSLSHQHQADCSESLCSACDPIVSQ